MHAPWKIHARIVFKAGAEKVLNPYSVFPEKALTCIDSYIRSHLFYLAQLRDVGIKHTFEDLARAKTDVKGGVIP